MRILIIHNILNDSRSMNGVLRHYAWMAEEWNKSGHQTDFVMAKAGFRQMREVAPSARLYSSDSFFDASKHIQQTWRYFPAYALRMASVHFLRIPERYDVVYASAPVIFEMYPALVLQKRFDAALAVKVHHVVSVQAKRRGFIDRLFFLSERVSARWVNQRADLVICNTPLVADDFGEVERSQGLTPVAKVPLGCGVDYDLIAANGTERKKYDAVILSRMHEQKGVFDIPAFWSEVVRSRPEAKLLVIGEGAHRPRTQQLVREAGLDHSVIFTGGISEAEKNRLIGESRIGISLSYEEGWGMAINEFLAVGLPVVAYDLPVFHYAFPDQLIVVPRGESRKAGAEVIRLLNDESLREQLAQRGAEFVRRYDFKELAKAELAALGRAVEDHRARAETGR